MKLYALLASAALVLLSACDSSTEVPTVTPGQEDAIAFDTYVAKGTTRGAVNTQDDLQSAGFGVFAYYSEDGAYPGVYSGDDYSGANSSIEANFMWNQLVSYSSTAKQWAYTPLKYWPNAFRSGAVDDHSATAGKSDRLSFFAYSPYVPCKPDGTPRTADAKSVGIVGVTANNAKSDPKITYVAPTASALTDEDDLLWGVSAVDTYTNAAGETSRALSGLPMRNFTKATSGSALQLSFRHAAMLLKLSISAIFDTVGPATGSHDEWSRILVESITLSGGASRGVLNLNNVEKNVPRWEVAAGTAEATRQLSGDALNSSISLPLELRTAKSLEETLDDDYFIDVLPIGVTKDEKTPFVHESHGYIVIPFNGDGSSLQTMSVRVVYKVITRDPSLVRNKPKGFSVITNDITGTLALPASAAFEGGKVYKAHLTLGMTTVKFNVTSVGEWAVGSSSDSWFPKNK